MGNPREFYAVIWPGPEKAVLMAAHADGRGYGSNDGIYDVLVHEKGPAGRDQNGMVAIDTDLYDRMEF